MNTSILRYLEYDALNHPDRAALADENRQLTYREYLLSAQTIGTYLAANITKGQMRRPIVVLIDRNVYSVLAFMGCLYSGNFYVPVDATMPAERIRLILETASPLCILDAREAGKPWNGAIRVVDILEDGSLDSELMKFIQGQVIDADPLYAIFTSGSTGIPKGVLISHRSALNMTESFGEAFGFDDDLVFGNQAPFDFDVSVKDIYNSLRCGARLEIIPKRLFMLPKLLIEYLNERTVNILIWAVSALRIVANFKTLDSIDTLPRFKFIMFSGEVMPVKVLNYWKDHVPSARYVNLYGPTEITCNCTYYEVTRRYEDAESLPIGRALPNYRVFLRDEAGKILNQPNVVGEICVEGAGVALGYWNDPERTQQAFIQNPLATGYRSTVYATGDMAYYAEDGNLVFASRKDYQIKHMGHRIELGEIETALNAIPFMDVACCLYNTVDEKIVCFYQSSNQNVKDIVAELGKYLPKYMWPNQYVHMEQMPLNKNGKVDRQLLNKQLYSQGTVQ